MGRRGCDADNCPNPDPPKKRNRTASNNHAVNVSVNIEQPLPPGEVLTDVTQKQWKIGKPIGCGSFGEIYLASDDIDDEEEVTANNARYVLKVEPHSNGPLFVEIHCLIRTAKHHMIKKWKEDKQLKTLGMPHFIANGSHVLGETRYRFLVLPRYDMDLQKLSRTMNFGRIHPRNVLVLAAQILDTLEYLHSKGYTHSDIKSSNLMVGYEGSQFQDQRTCRYSLPNSATNSLVSSAKKSSVKTYSGYYEDEDFDLNDLTDYSSVEESDDDTTVKKNKRQRNGRAKKVFNLRKLKSSVNYGDGHSSVCSSVSYQRSLKGSRERMDLYSSDEGFHEGARSKRCSESNDDAEVDYFEEAILSQASGQVYLLDYGLASKFVNSDGTHKEFGMDQRKAHDGTLEYSSRDSHIGAHSRRSDLENLGFNVVDWLTGSLPWKAIEIIEDPDLVHAVKKNYMNDVKQFLRVCFKTTSYPKFLETYFEYITTLEFTQKPDYQFCKKLFCDEFVDCKFGTEADMVLNFNKESLQQERKKMNFSKKIASHRGTKNTSPEFLKRAGITKPSGRENYIMNTWENSIKMDLLRQGLSLSNDGNRKPCASRNFYVSDAILIQKLRQSLLPILETPSKKFSPKNLRSKKIINKKKKKGKNNKRSSIGKFGNFLGSGKQYTWAEILAGNPEDIIRKDKCEATSADPNKKPRSRKVSNASEVSVTTNDVNSSPKLLRRDFLANKNPTYAMKEVVANYRRKISGKVATKSDENEDGCERSGYTYAMLRVMRNRDKRIKRERQQDENDASDCARVANKRNNRTVVASVASAVKSVSKNGKRVNVRLQGQETSNKDIESSKRTNGQVVKRNNKLVKSVESCVDTKIKTARVLLRQEVSNVRTAVVGKSAKASVLLRRISVSTMVTSPRRLRVHVKRLPENPRQATAKTETIETEKANKSNTKVVSRMQTKATPVKRTQTTEATSRADSTAASKAKPKTPKPSRVIATRSKMLRRNV